MFKWCYRRIARSTDERTLIACLLDPSVFIAESIPINTAPQNLDASLWCVALLNSWVLDYVIRFVVSANLSMHFLEILPLPRKSFLMSHIVEWSEKLQRRLGQAVSNTPRERLRLRLEMDALIAR